ncbi:lipopolysaccharide heptosyltransferase II [bacterium]|nr:lipopolysaccharide heptosyltransferase II [bacterium]
MPERILIFQTAYLGDVVLTTSLVGAVAARFPNAKIDLVVQPAWAPIVAHHPRVSRVITFDKRGAERGAAGTWRFARRIRKEAYDLALCPHPSFRSGLILRLARIPERVGHAGVPSSIFMTARAPRDKSRHEVIRQLALMAPLGGSIDDPPPLRIEVDPSIDVTSLLLRFGVPADARLAGLHPGSVWATKRWLPERFAEVGQELSRRVDRVLVFSGPGEEALSASIAHEIGDAAIDLGGRLKIAELCAVMSRLSLLVTNDSGPMHIAAALGVPIVAVFGSTVPALGYGPWTERKRIIETELICRPCGPHGRDRCPLGHFRCMREIAAADVVRACDELLEAS